MQLLRINIRYILFIAGILLLFSCDTGDDSDLVGFGTDDVFTISSYLQDNSDDYSSFLQVLENTGLYHTLNAYNSTNETGGFTLFVPTNEAFDKYIQNSDKYNTFDELLNDSLYLHLLIRYHIVNNSISSSDFPYGALADSTASGDFLSIGLQITVDTSIYKVNNIAPLSKLDIEASNGYVHVINEVLEPISYSGFEWVNRTDGFSLLGELFEITGLNESMGIYKTGKSGLTVLNRYTILAEHDSIFARYNINSIDDLIAKYHTSGLEYTDPNGGLYQFAAYHILDGKYFLDAFESTKNYNSYAVYPVAISAGLEFKVNTGIDTFKTIITDIDTSYIDYISIDMVNSNVNTKNGPIHFVSEVLELYEPKRTDITFAFTNDALIADMSIGTNTLYDPEKYEFLDWNGVETIIYRRPASETADKYIELEGDFGFKYTFPAVLPGEYEVYFQMNRNNRENATIQVKIDGRKAGGNINLASGAGAFSEILVGTINFIGTDEHTIEINTLVPGRMRWKDVRLKIPD